MTADADSGLDDDEMSAEEAADEPFLSEPEEEVVAATPEVELLNDVTQHYLNEIGAKPLFTAQEEYDWACRARAGEFEARQKMISTICGSS